MWTGPATAVLVVGGGTALLVALLMPETRPANLVGGVGMVLLAAALDAFAQRSRRRGAPARRGARGGASVRVAALSR